MKEPQPRGFDYGCLPGAMAVASLEFPTYLTSASVDGVAYGWRWSEAVNQKVPTISLVAQSGGELAKAFEEFHAWAQITDPDSVEVTFIFRKTGGFLLVLSTEYSRLMRRCLGFDRAYQAMGAGCIWCKPIDSINPFLRKFRNYCSSPIAPFFFNGVTYASPTNGLRNSGAPDVSAIPGLNPLLKFEVTLVDEDEVTQNSTAWIALKLDSRKETQLKPEGRKPNPDDIAKLRAKTLRHHFPVTLERIRRIVSLQPTIQHLKRDGVRPWQIEQALCNLVLSAAMGRGLHYLGLSARKAEGAIIEGIRSRYELADGNDIQTFSIEDISTQVTADGKCLAATLQQEKAKGSLGNPESLAIYIGS